MILDNINSHSGIAEKIEPELYLCGPLHIYGPAPLPVWCPFAFVWLFYTCIGRFTTI